VQYFQLGDDDLDEEDPFAEVEQILDAEQSNDSLEADVHRDKIARMCSFVNDLLDGMSAEADELAIRDGCIYLVSSQRILQYTATIELASLKGRHIRTSTRGQTPLYTVAWSLDYSRIVAKY
jgi:hypothetical protein